MPCATEVERHKKKVERLCVMQRFTINENSPEMDRK